ncbi:hypothetical protein [Leptolyngbya ohadii]|uniref:hypothetical protein n=1 Tax=Leptolyngbya ohadii TaxID=1962290 RepID=UPI000B59D451|nr:hypothetical protein [Leptolyngbya ohadii]
MTAGRLTTAEKESMAIAIIKQRPGIDQDRLAVALGYNPWRNNGRGRNFTVSELILKLDREGKIRAERGEFAMRTEPYKLYPPDYEPQKRPLFQPVYQPECKVVQSEHPIHRSNPPATLERIARTKSSREHRPTMETLADKKCSKPVRAAPIKPEKKAPQRISQVRRVKTPPQRKESQTDSYLPYISIVRPTSLGEFIARSHLSYHAAKTVLGSLVKQGKVRAFSQGWIRVIERSEA